MRSIRCVVVLAPALFAATAALSARAAVVITDGEFVPANWSFAAYPYGANGGGGSAFQELVNGNPGAARQVANDYGPSNSGSYNANFYEALSYNPVIGGPLTDLSFSIDSRFIDGLNALGFAVRQNGSVWGIGYWTNTSSWQTYSITPVASDYFLNPFNIPTPGQPALPDFSATGAPITFGFYTGNGSAGGPGETRHGLFDNFAVSFVPAPSAAAALALGFTAVRRRRNRR